MRSTIEILAALALTLVSLLVVRTGDERALYGHEGNLAAYFQPRELAGWPAPFVADSPNTSVIHQIGPEDDLRPFNLLASLAFWWVAVRALSRHFRRKQ